MRTGVSHWYTTPVPVWQCTWISSMYRWLNITCGSSCRHIQLKPFVDYPEWPCSLCPSAQVASQSRDRQSLSLVQRLFAGPPPATPTSCKLGNWCQELLSGVGKAANPLFAHYPHSVCDKAAKGGWQRGGTGLVIVSRDGIGLSSCFTLLHVCRKVD